MRRPRQERTSVPRALNRVVPSPSVEPSRPQLGMSYNSVINSTIQVTSWTASLAASNILLEYAPSARMILLFDEYRVLSAKIRFHFTPSLPSSVSYGHSHAVCFDPSGSSLVPDYYSALAYRNSDNMYLTAFKPVHEYTIRGCTHVVSNTLVADALKTDVTWEAGNIFVAPMATATETINYTVEYVVEFSKPRAS